MADDGAPAFANDRSPRLTDNDLIALAQLLPLTTQRIDARGRPLRRARLHAKRRRLGDGALRLHGRPLRLSHRRLRLHGWALRLNLARRLHGWPLRLHLARRRHGRPRRLHLARRRHGWPLRLHLARRRHGWPRRLRHRTLRLWRGTLRLLGCGRWRLNRRALGLDNRSLRLDRRPCGRSLRPRRLRRGWPRRRPSALIVLLLLRHQERRLIAVLRRGHRRERSRRNDRYGQQIAMCHCCPSPFSKWKGAAAALNEQTVARHFVWGEAACKLRTPPAKGPQSNPDATRSTIQRCSLPCSRKGASREG